MTKGLPRSLSRGKPLDQASKKLRITVNEPMSFLGVSGAAIDQTAVIAGLPEGNILLLGAVANLVFSGPTSANLVDTWEGDFGIGTTPADDNTISGADVDIIGSTAITIAVAEVTPAVRATNATTAIIDNTAGTAEVNLNVLVDADDVTDTETVIITVTGTVDILYSMLGDD